MNLKINFSKLLLDLLLPILSLMLIVIMYFIFIGPYLTNRSTISSQESSLNEKIKLLEEKKAVLENARENRSKLESYRSSLNKIVPDDANASDLVGVLDVLSKANSFTNVEENKNVISNENTRRRVVEIRFNGRTQSVATALKFLEDVYKYPGKQFSLNRVELTANPEERFSRISFNSYSPFNPDRVSYMPDSPVNDILSNKSITETLDKLIR